MTIQELLVSSLAQSDALAKLLIEKGITRQEFLQKISEERATYQKLLNPVAPGVFAMAIFEPMRRSINITDGTRTRVI